MAIVSTVRVTSTGYTGSPGYSRFNFFELADVASCNAAGAAVKSFFTGLNSYLQVQMSYQVDGTVQHHDLATGALTGETSMSTVPTPAIGIQNNTVVYTGGSGFVVDWITGAVWQGHKVRGRTFIVPSVLTNANDGTVLPAVVTAGQAAGAALIADPTTTFAVWAKKFDDSKPPKQTAGALFAVTGAIVPDRSAQLRSRRS